MPWHGDCIATVSERNPAQETIMVKVLIVDDEENIRFSFGSILADEGYDIVEAATLAEAEHQ